MIDFIHNNIHLLKPEHLRIFAQKNHISYTEEELQTIYQFILNNYQELLKGNIQVIKKIESNINPTLYQKLITLFNKYQNKITR